MDNFFHMCPSKTDGRQLTDYQSDTKKNESIKYANNIYRDDQYRLSLQTGGKDLLNREWEFNKKNNSCWVNGCVHVYPTRVLVDQMIQEKQLYDSIYNSNTNQKLASLRRCPVSKDYRMTY